MEYAIRVLNEELNRLKQSEDENKRMIKYFHDANVAVSKKVIDNTITVTDKKQDIEQALTYLTKKFY